MSIYATNYYGTVTLQKDFLDTHNNYYPSGLVTENSILESKTLVPGVTVVLANNADNSTTLSTFNGKKCIVALDDRTFYKDGSVKFVGHYSPFTIDEGNINEIVIVDSDNQIGYSETPRELESCRAYFWVKPNDNGDASAGRVIFGPYEVPTMITTTDFTEDTDKNDAWYSVDGRRLGGMPMQRGVYVNSGRKIIIK